MNASAFTSFYRALARHRLYAAFNIGGLAVGIAVFLVLGLYVRFETSFEKWLPRHEGIYAVRTIWTLQGNPFSGPYPHTMGGLLDQMKQDFPGIVGTRTRTGGTGVVRGGVTTKEDLVQADPDFFRVFDLPMVRGDKATALTDPTSAIISESMARKYFGTTDPVGQTMTITMDRPQTYRITGVFADLPRNTELKMSAVMLLPKTPPQDNWYHWGSSTLQTYLRFDTPAAARAFEQKLPAFVKRRAFNDMGADATKLLNLDLLPIERVHLEPQGSASATRKITVTTLGLVGLLTLLIAIVNYVNLATARAGLRAREVAMRKVLGASRAALIRQFVGEAVMTVAIAALIGLILAELGLPLVNAAGGLALSIPYGLVVPALVLLVLIVGVAAGFYPALLLSGYPAAAVLASARSPGGGRAGARVREALVVFQFGLAIAFMIGTVVLLAQTRHVRQTDLGYQREGLVTIMSTTDNLVTPERRRAIADAVRRLPNVTNVALANDAVGESGERNSDNMPLPGVAGEGPSLRWVITGPGFFDTYGARLLAGRVFDDARRDDDAQLRKSAEGVNIVINRSAVPVLRFRTPQEAIGKTVGGSSPRTIIGVVDDLRFGSPRDPTTPMYFLYYREAEKAGSIVATIRHQGDPRALIDAIRGIWRRLAPEVPFDAEPADKRLAKFYEADDQATRLFAIGAGLAVLIGCVGLWGLASFNTARRTKEIGIRKTLGASSGDIVKLLVGQFLRPVLIANLVAWPLAYVAMRTWLAGFSDAIALSPLYFLGASALAIVIAVLTVLGQSLRASRAAPAWALRRD